MTSSRQITYQMTMATRDTYIVQNSAAVTAAEPAIVKEENEIYFMCPSCPKTFYNKTALKNHHNLMHGIMSDDTYDSVSPRSAVKTEQLGSPETADAVDSLCNSECEATCEEAEEGRGEAVAVTLEDAQKLVSLASHDVSYIIVKTGTGGPTGMKRRRAGSSRSPHKVKTDLGPLSVAGPFVCHKKSNADPSETCNMEFHDCCEYTMHYSREHTKKRKPGLKCQVCEQELEGEALEKAEENPRPRPWVCSLCSKAFTQQGGLIQHMRMHTGQRPFPCTVCDKHFTQKAGLDQHMRTHTKVKPFVCVVCEKGFTQAIHLRQHMRTHTNITPFQCAICRRRFKQASHLNFHLRTHQSEIGEGETEDRDGEMVSVEFVPAEEVIVSE